MPYKDPEKKREADRIYDAARREQTRARLLARPRDRGEYMRQYDAGRRELRKEYLRQYDAGRRELKKEYMRRYNAERRGQQREYRANRRNGGTIRCV